jgi:hypothetical protein
MAVPLSDEELRDIKRMSARLERLDAIAAELGGIRSTLDALEGEETS